MRALNKIILLAQEESVVIRNRYRYDHADLITNCIKNITKMHGIVLITDLFGYNLSQATLIINSMRDDNLTYQEALIKHNI